MPTMCSRSSLLFPFRVRILFMLVTAELLVSCGGNGSNTQTGPTLQSIAVAPGTATVAAGLTEQFTATDQYSDGSSRAMVSAVWSSSSASVATISTGGLATTLTQGNVTKKQSGQLTEALGSHQASEKVTHWVQHVDSFAELLDWAPDGF